MTRFAIYFLFAVVLLWAFDPARAYAEPAAPNPSCLDWAVATVSGPNPTAARWFYDCASPEFKMQLPPTADDLVSAQAHFAPAHDVTKIGSAPANRGGTFHFYAATSDRGNRIWYIVTINSHGQVEDLE